MTSSFCLWVIYLQEKYKLKLPPYPGTSQCVKLSGHSCSMGTASVDPASIRLNYSLAEQSGGLVESDVNPDPIKQFDAWFKVRILNKPASAHYSCTLSFCLAHADGCLMQHRHVE